ncbi:MAG: carbohydrate-binding protein, partial [Sphingobacteriaceae bacterium]
YGQGWFTQNNDAQLVRVSYNAGNRKPNVVVKADKTEGAVPLKVNFSSAGTDDFDKDELIYKWSITTSLSKTPVQLKGKDLTYSFLKKGVYKIKLTVTDAKGAASSQVVTVKAGNETPVIDIKVTGNQTYYLPGNAFAYAVTMRDKEDGIIPGGKIPSSKLKVNIAVEPDEDQENKPGHQYGPESFATGKALMLKSDCKACHDDTRKIIGPAYKTIAAKYTYDEATVEKLAVKVINGGNGVWGEMSMSAHPQLPKEDAKAIVSYILNITSIPAQPENLPAKGSYIVADASGPVAIKAAYTDRGVPGIPPASVQKILLLQSPVIQAASGKLEGDFQVYGKRRGRSAVFVKKTGTIIFENMDVTGVHGFDINVSTPNQMNGGKIEIRLDKPDGQLLATATVGKGLERSPVTLTTKPLTGKHNVYFIFSGTDSRENLFFVDNITLKGK